MPPDVRHPVPQAPPTYINPEGGQLYTQQFVTTRGDSPARVLTTSPILADRRG